MTVLLCLGFINNCPAVIVEDESLVNAKVPSNIISVETGYVIVVEKSTQNLFLYHHNNGITKLVEVYQCSSGKRKGDKFKRGDLKTPEGIYCFNEMFNDAQLPSRYGVMALVTNYPNYIDRSVKKGGNGIWLHGIDRDLIPYDSKGCVALNNSDIIHLNQYLRLYQTPIVIEDTVSYLPFKDNHNLKTEVVSFLEKWRKAWTEKDLESYISSYSRKKFVPPKGGWQRWRAYKDRLNKKYNSINVEFRDVNILRHDNYIVVSFYQTYSTSSFKSSGFKQLYLERNSDELKISAELFTETDYVKRPEAFFAQSDKELLKAFLNKWLLAWENKNLDNYMNCYSRSFISRKMNWRKWKVYKRQINEENRLIKVTVINPSIRINDSRATITFTQKYISDSFTDYGIKKLILKNEEGSWKIVEENWEPI